jgi:flagellum-specific peptidoglycan hydrolase FlgJ
MAVSLRTLISPPDGPRATFPALFGAFALAAGLLALAAVSRPGATNAQPEAPLAAAAPGLAEENLARASAFLARPTPVPLEPAARARSRYDVPLPYPYSPAPSEARQPGGAVAAALATAEPTGPIIASTGRPADQVIKARAAVAWQAEFIESIGMAARAAPFADRVPASITIAQAILESDWGRSSLAHDARNYFGIKAQDRSGSAGYVVLPTLEYGDGEWYTVDAPFRAYASVADSVADHHRFLVENPRYRGALAVGANAEAFAHALQRAGYATDPRYAAKLLAYMDLYDLYRYDRRET